MRAFLDHVLSNNLARVSINARTVAIIVAIGIGVFVAIYAMTVNPNDAATTIGFPP
jgi:hypothetical protein